MQGKAKPWLWESLKGRNPVCSRSFANAFAPSGPRALALHPLSW